MSANSRCPDWVFSNNSDVHVARDHSWFTSYTPFETYVTNYIDGSGAAAKGIGSVELKVETDRAQSGPQTQKTIVLYDVLHVPTAVCNIFGHTDRMKDNKLELYFGRDGAALKTASGNVEALLDVMINGLYILKLIPGQATSQSHIGSGMYTINVQWPASERLRWCEFRCQCPSSSTGHPFEGIGEAPPNTADAPPYSDEEKAWLMKHFESEFKFFWAHWLNIFKEEDREEGRRIARALMECDDDNRPDGDKEEFEFGPADLKFSAEELEWIKTYYPSTNKFMEFYDLEFYDNNDLEEAQRLVQSFMNEGAEDAMRETIGCRPS